MLASHGLIVNTTKTEVMASTGIYKDMNVVDDNNIVLKQVDGFKYLGVMLSEKGGSGMAVRARVNAAWLKWKEMSGVIYHKRMPRKLKVKLYKTVIRPVLTYGAETWTLRTKEENTLEATEMRMLRRLKRVTLLDHIRSEDIRKELDVDPIMEKIRAVRLRWFGHIVRMSKNNLVKLAWKMEVDGKRPVGRPRKRWSDNIKEDLSRRGLTKEDALEKNSWRERINLQRPRPGNIVGQSG